MWLFNLGFISFSIFSAKSWRNLELPAAPESNKNAIGSPYTKLFAYAHLIIGGWQINKLRRVTCGPARAQGFSAPPCLSSREDLLRRRASLYAE